MLQALICCAPCSADPAPVPEPRQNRLRALPHLVPATAILPLRCAISPEEETQRSSSLDDFVVLFSGCRDKPWKMIQRPSSAADHRTGRVIMPSRKLYKDKLTRRWSGALARTERSCPRARFRAGQSACGGGGEAVYIHGAAAG